MTHVHCLSVKPLGCSAKRCCMRALTLAALVLPLLLPDSELCKTRWKDLCALADGLRCDSTCTPDCSRPASYSDLLAITPAWKVGAEITGSLSRKCMCKGQQRRLKDSQPAAGPRPQ